MVGPALPDLLASLAGNRPGRPPLTNTYAVWPAIAEHSAKQTAPPFPPG